TNPLSYTGFGDEGQFAPRSLQLPAPERPPRLKLTRAPAFPHTASAAASHAIVREIAAHKIFALRPARPRGRVRRLSDSAPFALRQLSRLCRGRLPRGRRRSRRALPRQSRRGQRALPRRRSGDQLAQNAVARLAALLGRRR